LRNLQILLILLLGTEAWTIQAQQKSSGKISPPSLPINEIRAPKKTGKDAYNDLQRMRNRRLKRESLTRKPAPKPQELLDSRIEKLMQQKRPFRLHMSASFGFPKVFTTGSNRKKYFGDGLAAYNLYLRPDSNKPTNKTTIWTGARFAGFGGTGIYKNIAGRFSFIYYGPMAGIGKISLGPQNFRSKKEGSKNSTAKLNFDRQGFFLMSGISLLARQSKIDESKERPDDDFNNQTTIVDAPGVWLEFTWVKIKYSAYSINYTLGAQGANSKSFVYAAVGMGLWY